MEASRGRIRAWWTRLDVSAKGALTLAAFAAVVAAVVRASDQVVFAAQLEAEMEKAAAVDQQQDEDIDLLFQTQVRLVTSVENLQHEVREVRKDLRALDAGRPLPPLRAVGPLTAPEEKP